MPYVATQRLYRTEDNRAVPEGHPDARWLLTVPGRQMSDADARRYGLVSVPEAEPEAEPDPEPETPKPATSKPKASRKPKDDA